MDGLAVHSLHQWIPKKILSLLHGLPAAESRMRMELLTAHNAYMSWYLEKNRCRNPMPTQELLTMLRTTVWRASRVLFRSLNLSLVASNDEDSIASDVEGIAQMMSACLKSDVQDQASVPLSLLCMLHAAVLGQCGWRERAEGLVEDTIQYLRKLKGTFGVNNSLNHGEDTSSTDNDEPSTSDALSLAGLMQARFYLEDSLRDLSQAMLFSLDISSSRSAMLVPYMHYKKAELLYKSGDIPGTLSVLEEIKSQDDLDDYLASRMWNIVGCCMADQAKPHTAIQLFKKAMIKDFRYYLPMYNIAVQYKQMQQNDAELETLNLLATMIARDKDLEVKMDAAPPRSKDLHMMSTLVDVYVNYAMEDEEFTEESVIFRLATRCLELQKYDVAASKFLRLLDLIKKGNSKMVKKHSSPELIISSIPYIYQQRAFSLLMSRSYEECITFCEELIQKETGTYCCDGDSSRLVPLQAERQPLINNSSQSSAASNMDKSLSRNGSKECKRQVIESQSSGGKKRLRSEEGDMLECTPPHGMACHAICQFRNMDINMHAILYRAAALTHNNQLEDAIQSLKTFFSKVNNPVLMASGVLVPSEGEDLPRAKRQRLENENDPTNAEREYPASQCRGIKLIAEAYGQMSFLCSENGQFRDALHFSRLAIQTDISNCILHYNHCLVLELAKQTRGAATAWLDFRDMSTNMESFQLDFLIKKKKRLLTSRVAELEMLPPVTSRLTEDRLLEMDVHALESVACGASKMTG